MTDSEAGRRRRGFPAGAERAAVVARAAEVLRAGETLDLRKLAREAGIGRTTLYRWFGDRAGLTGEALWVLVDRAWSQARGATEGTGSRHVCQVMELFLHTVRNSPPASSLVANEPRLAVIAIMSPTGQVQRRAVARVHQLLDERCPLADGETRAVAEILTQVLMTYVWAHLLTGATPDLAAPLAIVERLLRETR